MGSAHSLKTLVEPTQSTSTQAQNAAVVGMFYFAISLHFQKFIAHVTHPLVVSKISRFLDVRNAQCWCILDAWHGKFSYIGN